MTSEDAIPIAIRTVTLDDLPGIFHLGEQVFTPQEVSNLYRTWDEYVVTTLFNTESEHMFVAEADGTLAGFALGTIIRKTRSAWTYGHLLWLAVDPAWGQRGIGSLLFDRFRDAMEAAGVRILLIDTQADNDGAIRFFERKGFCKPVDHVYMTLNLEGGGEGEGAST